jgi:hypothetical protein
MMKQDLGGKGLSKPGCTSVGTFDRAWGVHYHRVLVMRFSAKNGASSLSEAAFFVLFLRKD